MHLCSKSMEGVHHKMLSSCRLSQLRYLSQAVNQIRQDPPVALRQARRCGFGTIAAAANRGISGVAVQNNRSSKASSNILDDLSSDSRRRKSYRRLQQTAGPAPAEQASEYEGREFDKYGDDRRYPQYPQTASSNRGQTFNHETGGRQAALSKRGAYGKESFVSKAPTAAYNRSKGSSKGFHRGKLMSAQ
jgi:hypothetical protein